MLLRLLFLFHLTVVFANPFHKYPYVFLLDIGNEELQTNSQQIRVTIPGGSMALRYPAIGEGDSIAHIRVSGIDFGTGLKANIVDGGPGYNYVVIVFVGNPGATYDAVVTVSTLTNETSNNVDADSEGTGAVKSSYQVVDHSEPQEDLNDSAEGVAQTSNEKEERIPSASNFYDSAENEEANGKEDVNDKDVLHRSGNNNEQYEQKEVQDYGDADDQESQDYNSDKEGSEEENSKVKYAHESYESSGAVKMNRNLYDKYNVIRARLYDRVEDYPQEVNDAENEVDNDHEEYSPKDPSELDQMFNDEEIHTDGENYMDSNNYSDSHDNVAVAY